MTLYRILGFAVLGLAVILLLRAAKSELALPLSALVNLLLLGAAVGILLPVLDYLRTVSGIAGTGTMLTVLFKSVGVALLCGIASSLCRDCGEPSLAVKVDLCGRCVILALALPLLRSVFDMILAVLPA